MNILDNWLKKKNINHYDELSEEEKKIYDEYEKALNVPELKVEDIEIFVRQQLNLLSNEIISFTNSEKKDLFIKAQMSVMRSILAFITKDLETKKMVEEKLKKELN